MKNDLKCASFFAGVGGIDYAFDKVPNLANTRLYKQAGNSVLVSVIERIALEIKKVLFDYYCNID